MRIWSVWCPHCRPLYGLPTGFAGHVFPHSSYPSFGIGCLGLGDRRRQSAILGQVTSLSKRRLWSLPISASDLSGAAANGGFFHFANRTCTTKNGPALFCLSDRPCSYGPLNYILLPNGSRVQQLDGAPL